MLYFLWGILSAAAFARAIELNDFWMELLVIVVDVIVVSLILVGGE